MNDVDSVRARLAATRGVDWWQTLEELADGDELRVPTARLIRHGRTLFEAVFTPQEGAGRPLTKGVGDPLTDPGSPLVFPRDFNRLSAMDANSCSSCHGVPFLGGGGHFTANAFLIGQRFDWLTFDHLDTIPLRGTLDERGLPVTLPSFNSRNTLGMFGSGFIEMLARQITSDLRAIRDGMAPGQTKALASKGIAYGQLTRRADGTWDTSAVQGIPASSLVSTSSSDPPSLIIRPFHQSGTVISIRQFTNNAFNHEGEVEREERFGVGVDESTVLVVEPSGRWRVLGESVAVVYDARLAFVTKSGPLGATGVVMHVPPAGSVYDPRTNAVTFPVP